MPLANPGLRTILPSAGPLANDLDALEILIKSVVDSRPALVDSTATDVPWRSIDPLKPVLRFGVLAEDPLFPWHPPVKAAVTDTADLLRSQGHEVVYLTSQQCLVGESYDVASQMFGLDKTAARILADSGEPLVPSLLYIREAVRGVSFDRSYLRDTRAIKDRLERLSILNVKMSEIQESWREVWAECRLDAVVGPGAQNTAVEHDMYALAPYTCLFNLLDVSGCNLPWDTSILLTTSKYPACVVPVGHVKESNSEDSFVKLSGQFAPPCELALFVFGFFVFLFDLSFICYIACCVNALFVNSWLHVDHPRNLEGAPTAIQIITTRMRDEECLGIARLIDRYVRARSGGAISVAKL